MHRRHFLRATANTLAAVAIPGRPPAWGKTPEETWREFALTTQVNLPPSGQNSRIWLPLPLGAATPFQQPPANDVQCAGGHWRMASGSLNAPAMLLAEFPPHTPPVLTVTSRVRVRDWSVDLQRPGPAEHFTAAERGFFLRPTRFVPTDGLVRAKALEITRGAVGDEAQARAIYEWIVVNTYRKAAVRGCGTGNIRVLLETGDLGGKCADLSALFVGLARAISLPAREVYGIRVAPSRLGFSSLGPKTSDISHAQHCRAEVWLARFGWVPVDPADVRKVILEEPPGNLPINDPKVLSAQHRLFGAWEMNWVAFNSAQDIPLPGSSGPPVPFLMYPQAETVGGRLDSLDPDTFRYKITAVPV